MFANYIFANITSFAKFAKISKYTVFSTAIIWLLLHVPIMKYKIISKPSPNPNTKLTVPVHEVLYRLFICVNIARVPVRV